MVHPHRKKSQRRPPRFELIAGSVCLDFINTLDDRFTGQPKELLASYIDLARFAEDAQILDENEVDRLFALSQADPQNAHRAVDAAIQLREAMYQVFWAIVQKQTVPQAALFTLNGYVQMAAQHCHLVPVNGRMEWRFDDARNHFEGPLWPIARSAADLLASDQLPFVRACASQKCQWLFLDSSKNHRRRWCDMKLCGNREKFRSFYRRSKRNSRASAR